MTARMEAKQRAAGIAPSNGTSDDHAEAPTVKIPVSPDADVIARKAVQPQTAAANANTPDFQTATDKQHNALSVSFTVVKSDSDIGKRFSAPDGKTISKEVLGALYAGTATTQTLSGATAGDILEQLGKIVLGLPVQQRAPDGHRRERQAGEQADHQGPGGAGGRTRSPGRRRISPTASR